MYDKDFKELVKIGGDMKFVQGDSGHAQVKMIADVYSHIIDDRRIFCGDGEIMTILTEKCMIYCKSKPVKRYFLTDRFTMRSV